MTATADDEPADLRATQLRRLADTALALTAVRDVDGLLHTVTAAAADIVGARRATTSRLTPGVEPASVHVTRPGPTEGAGPLVGPSPGRVLLDPVLRDRRPVRLTRAELERTPQSRDPHRAAGTAAPAGYLGVPLLGGDSECLGALLLWDKLGGGAFDADDEAIAVQLAQMASAAIERIELIARERAARSQAEHLARRYRLLSEASKQLSATLEPAAALATVGRLVVPGVADWCALDLVEEGGVRRAHVFAADPALAGPADAGPAGAAAATVPPAVPPGDAVVLRTDVTDEVLAAVTGDADLAARLRAGGMATALVVPLVARGAVLGTMTLLRTGPAFTAEDRELVEELAARAAQAIDNATRYAFERDLAATLQRSLLPQALPVARGITVASRYLPGASGTQVGGDWYDLIDLGRGRLALVVGDVMGRGVAAATVMGQLRSAVRAYALDGHGPVELLRRVDRVVQALGDSQLTTCIYAVYDTSTRDLTLATAGHLPPLLIDASGPRYLDLEPGVPLGVGEGGFGQSRVPLAAGSTVLLYTDGLVEGRDCPIGTGMSRLLEAARSAPAGAEALCDHVLRELGRDGEHDDDTALLAVTLTPADEPDPHSPAELWLPPEPGSAATARAFVTETLHERGLDRCRDVAVLLVSELVTNALRHARTELRVLVATAPDRLRVEVIDGSGQVPLPRHAVPDQDESGRGMVLIAGLSDRWGTEPGFGGKCVWFELDA